MSSQRAPDDEHLDTLVELASALHAQEETWSPCLTPERIRQAVGQVPRGEVLEHLLECQRCRVRVHRQAETQRAAQGQAALAALEAAPRSGLGALAPGDRETVGTGSPWSGLWALFSARLLPLLTPAWRPSGVLAALVIGVLMVRQIASWGRAEEAVAWLRQGEVFFLGAGTMGPEVASRPPALDSVREVRNLALLRLRWQGDATLHADAAVILLGLSALDQGIFVLRTETEPQGTSSLEVRVQRGEGVRVPYTQAQAVPPGRYRVVMLVGAKEEGASRAAAAVLADPAGPAKSGSSPGAWKGCAPLLEPDAAWWRCETAIVIDVAAGG